MNKEEESEGEWIGEAGIIFPSYIVGPYRPEPFEVAVYKTQTGGFACHNREIEGEFSPRSDEIEDRLIEWFTGPKYNGWCCEGIDEEDALFIESLLADKNYKVDRSKLKDSEEAWVWMLLRDVTPCVLVWTNSD